MIKPHVVFSNYDDRCNPWYAGGGALAVREVAERLVKNHTVTVLCGAYPGGVKKEIISGVEYRRIGTGVFGPHVGQLVFWALLPWYALRESYDVWIDSFTPPFGPSFVPFVASRPVIGLVHMLPGEDMWRKYWTPFFIVEQFGLRFYRHIIVLTEGMSRKVVRYAPHAIVHIIPNGVSMPAMRPDSPKSHVLFLGRIEIDQKGLDLLIRAYEMTSHELSLPLVIAGDGTPSEVRRLQNLIAQTPCAGRITLVGRVSGAKKAELLRAAKAVVMPSRRESFGITALEAMSYGTPVVCFNTEHFAWIPANLPFRAKPFDVRDFGDAMLRAVRAPAAFAERYRMFVAQYNWDAIAEAYRKCIDALTHTKGAVSQDAPIDSQPIFNRHIQRIVTDKIPCLFISPHLDDAALSAGGLISYLADKTSVEVATVFTDGGSPYGNTLSARQFLKQTGYRDAAALYNVRRAEDVRAYESIGVSWKHFGFTDAMWRITPHPSALRRLLGKFLSEFLHDYPTFRMHVARKNIVDPRSVAEVVDRLRKEFVHSERFAVFAPVAIDTHVDHVIVRRACEAVFPQAIWWVDSPYLDAEQTFGEDSKRFSCAIFSGHEKAKRHLVSAYGSQIKAMFPDGCVPLMPDRFVLQQFLRSGDNTVTPFDVALVIPAYNEAANIENALRSLLRQREEDFRIAKIVVLSDGSTDGTADAARSVRDVRIEVREYASRRGKAVCLQEVYRDANTDIIVSLDADTVFAHDRVLTQLVAPFRVDAMLGLASGGEEPFAPVTFTELAMNIGHFAREPLRGNNVFSADGKLMAIRKKFAETVQFPSDVIGIDHYLYFLCRKEGYGYRYVPSAKVLFRSPSTIRDAIRQNIRFGAVPFRMGKYFGRDVVEREYFVPFGKRFAAKFVQALRHPVATAYAFLIYSYCNIRGRQKEGVLTSRWDIAVSTKHALAHHE
jgi:glycosyltransferase involved in cell wall biosynthesis/LmbE family N-acetylglucosaminyl deacetylase